MSHVFVFLLLFSCDMIDLPSVLVPVLNLTTSRRRCELDYLAPRGSAFASKSVDSLSACHFRSASIRARSASPTARTASLPSKSRSGGASKLATRMIAAAAFDGSPGCAPLYSRWKRATAPTVAAYTGLSCAIVVEDP